MTPLQQQQFKGNYLNEFNLITHSRNIILYYFIRISYFYYKKFFKRNKNFIFNKHFNKKL